MDLPLDLYICACRAIITHLTKINGKSITIIVNDIVSYGNIVKELLQSTYYIFYTFNVDDGDDN